MRQCLHWYRGTVINIGQLMLLREELPHPRDVQRLAKGPEPRTASASRSA